MADEDEFPCPFCGGSIFPLFDRKDPNLPTGSWICLTCSVNSGEAIGCGGGIGSELRIVD